MAFVIEWVPDEDANKEYVLPQWAGDVKPGMFWTINHEKNIKLFEFYRPVDYPDQPYFAFIWKDHPIKVQFKKRVVGSNTMEWSLLQLCIPYEIENYREDILSDLRETMKIFGFTGRISLDGRSSGNAIINF